MGPSAALVDGKTSKSTKEGNAVKHGIVKVTPASIAYAAVQVSATFILK